MRDDARAAGGKEAIELVYAAFGQPDKTAAAIAALRRLESNIDLRAEAMRAGVTGMEWQWCWMPELRARRKDPRFDTLTRRLGFIEYWEEYGPPDEGDLRAGKLVCH
jgi:hypothetical protein